MANLFDDRRQILLGSLLGSGYIFKGVQNDYFCMKHSEKQKDWLWTKANELQVFASPKPFNKHKNTWTWRSSCDPLFTELRSFCYKDDWKTVTMEWLNELRDLAIAVWFGDSGTMTGRGKKNACLRTQKFGKEGNEIIERYFNEVGIFCNINKTRNMQLIVFTVEGTYTLLKMICNCTPSPNIMKLMPH